MSDHHHHHATGNPMVDTAIWGTTLLGSLAGVCLAEAAAPPAVNLATVALSAIGMATLWVRSHYSLAETKLRVARLEAELDWYRERERRGGH